MKKDSVNWKEESKRFDEAADYYDRFRPSYPEEMVNCIIDKTGIKDNSKILEIGAGSGKATELFVKKGFEMHCIEPGANLAEAGAAKFNYTDKVKYNISRFEEWDEMSKYFDLAISAQAFHWVPQPIGFEKCAKTLKANKYLALFWNMYLTNSQPVDDELAKLSEEYGGLLILDSKEACEKRIKSNIEGIKASGYFKEPEVYRFPWSQQYNAEEYIGFLRTGNGYLSLDEQDREIVDKKVTDIINRNGGSIVRPYLCVLYLAQK